MSFLIRWLVVALVLCRSMAGAEETGLIVCGAEEVFVVPSHEGVAKKNALWSWRAGNSPEIPEKIRGSFRTTDECKSYGETILITSSGGGVALIRRKDKACLFYATSKNAHSACLLPGNLVAVASSFGGDEVGVFDLGKSGAEAVSSVPLYGAHGVVWDAKRKRVWALGTKVLLLLRPDGRRLIKEASYELPAVGGHDLSWSLQDELLISVDEHCFRFDCDDRNFSPLKDLANEVKVKSIDVNRKSGRIVWHRGTKETWWSDTIRFLEPGREMIFRGERIYKVRWDQAREIPKQANGH